MYCIVLYEEGRRVGPVSVTPWIVPAPAEVAEVEAESRVGRLAGALALSGMCW